LGKQKVETESIALGFEVTLESLGEEKDEDKSTNIVAAKKLFKKISEIWDYTNYRIKEILNDLDCGLGYDMEEREKLKWSE
jgi:hypothetical protein